MPEAGGLRRRVVGVEDRFMERHTDCVLPSAPLESELDVKTVEGF